MNVQVDERAPLLLTLPPHATDRKEKESTLRLFRAPPARPVFFDDKACPVAWCDRSIPVTQASGHTLAQPVEGLDTGRQGRQAGTPAAHPTHCPTSDRTELMSLIIRSGKAWPPHRLRYLPPRPRGASLSSGGETTTRQTPSRPVFLYYLGFPEKVSHHMGRHLSRERRTLKITHAVPLMHLCERWWFENHTRSHRPLTRGTQVVLSIRMRLWTLDSGWPFALSPPRERVSPPLAINSIRESL